MSDNLRNNGSNKVKAEQAMHLLPMQSELGEGCRWSRDEGRLYWLDIENGYLFRWQPDAGEEPERFTIGTAVGSLAFRADGGLILGTKRGIGLWDVDDRELQIAANPEPNKPGARFNDGRVDPQGRFWAGTLTHTDATSSLYRFSADGSIKRMVSNITISNGLGWSPDGKTFYFTDTLRQTIYAYDFEGETGEISNGRVFVDVPKEEGSPDGLAVDSQGFVWGAHYGGSRVVRYDPTGKKEREVYLPVPNITCCCFGGPNLTDLFITTAWENMTEQARNQYPQAGDLFVLPTNIKGQSEYKFGS